ncbi:MAG: hypothetical protein Q7S09_02080 [bacterium]|nr:hypothetical protein [bacterium]
MDDIGKFNVCVNTVVNTFYVHNLMMHVVRTESPERSRHDLERYRKDLRDFGEKTLASYADIILSYLVIAIAGEVRNLDSRAFKIKNNPKKTKLAIKKLSEAGVCFEKSKARSVTQKQVLQSLGGSSDEEIKDFLEAAYEAFKYWKGSSTFGGRPWKRISQTALHYSQGKLDCGQFLDTVFTLEHHGGELFDKHPSFAVHTKSDVLKDQLEVQSKAKNIAQLIMGLTNLHKKFDEGLVELLRRGAAMQYWKRDLVQYCTGRAAIKKKSSEKKKGGPHA